MSVMSGDTIGLKVRVPESIAKCVQIIRQFDTSPMSTIKDRIAHHEYVLVCSYTDRIGLKRIIQCYKELVLKGIVPEVYELDDEPSTIEFLERLNATYDEISDEIEGEET